MKPREYCCCAIPMVNAGIYATLFEQFLLGLLVAVLAIATPSIVGASVPGSAKWILAVVCFVGCGVQLFGFLGVFKEKAIMFRRYTTIHIMITLGAFAVALTWIIMSATKHSTAVTDCENNFFVVDNSTDSSSPTLDEGQTLCNIFAWVDVGLMGGLWVILAIMQFYLYTVVSSYGAGQRQDHENYKSQYSVTNFDNGIPMANRADPWDARPSFDDEAARVPLTRGGHARGESDASVSTILAEKPQEARSFYANAVPATGYPPQPQRRGTYASTRQGSIGGRSGNFPQPSSAYTQDPQPTPYEYDNYYSGGPENAGSNFGRPSRAQAHPAEGMFGRKTSRYGDRGGSF
ncbi:hypothetical protein M0805_004992 [Coniferiporia weirii]|nr:hypothetical protein M0805_004992 [Coniferiporia weirii]